MINIVVILISTVVKYNFIEPEVERFDHPMRISAFLISDLKEVTKFNKSNLKKTETKEKNTLPTKEGIIC